MPSDKRERKRQSKQQKQEAYAEAARRRQRRRGRWVTGVAMIAALGIAFIGVLSFTTRNNRREVSADRQATTTTTAVDAPCPKADGTSARRDKFRRPPPFCIDTAKRYEAAVQTDVGTFTLELDSENAPEMTNNFVFLSRYHFYDGIPFNRVKPGFVVQGGNPPAEAVTGPGYVLADENVPKPPDKYKVGDILMARDRPNSNGSQFILIMGPEGEGLPLVFPRLGRVIAGMDVVRKIEADGGPDFNPRVIHTIQKITIRES